MTEHAQADIDGGTITHRIHTRASRAAVWTALTTPEHVAQWWKHPMRFPDGIRAGSVGTFEMADGDGFPVRIDRVEEPTAYQLTWGFGDDLDERRATTVLFELGDDEDGGTWIRVTESGFDRDPDLARRREAMDRNVHGWELVLQWLPSYAGDLT